jgi:outer membrane PBP1 activator LpoA protein
VPQSNLRVALLAPQTGAESGVGASLVNAAQLALNAPGAPALDVRDTQSTPEGAVAAATAAISAGDTLILGPLSSKETAAVAPIAQKAGVPVLAFTNDPSQAMPGIWTLGIGPAEQMRRLVLAAHNDMRMHLAALLPQNAYGDLVAAELVKDSMDTGFGAPNIVRYGANFASINRTIRELADYSDRRAPLDAKITAAKALHTPEGRKQAADLAKQPISPPSFDVLVVGASGEELKEIETLLPYYDITPDQVRFLGPSQWAYATGFDVSHIAGGWYAAPDPSLRTQFAQAYMDKFMQAAPQIADVAYDAASLARLLAAGQGFGTSSLSNPAGFAGVDGTFALQSDGHVKRGLAIFQMQSAGASQMVQPSPQNLSAAGK